MWPREGYNIKTYIHSSCEIQDFEVMFGRVCGFWGRVREAYRTSGSFRYGCGNVTELTEFPGIVERAYTELAGVSAR